MKKFIQKLTLFLCVCVACFLVGCDTEEMQDISTVVAEKQSVQSSQLVFENEMSPTESVFRDELQREIDHARMNGNSCDCEISITSVAFSNPADESSQIDLFGPNDPNAPGNPDNPDNCQTFLIHSTTGNCDAAGPCFLNTDIINGQIQPTKQQFHFPPVPNTVYEFDVKAKRIDSACNPSSINGNVTVYLRLDCEKVDQNGTPVTDPNCPSDDPIYAYTSFTYITLGPANDEDGVLGRYTVDNCCVPGFITAGPGF